MGHNWWHLYKLFKMKKKYTDRKNKKQKKKKTNKKTTEYGNISANEILK